MDANLMQVRPAPPVSVGCEDRFLYEVADGCIMCGTCVGSCPVGAVGEDDGAYRIDPAACIDCGTCAMVCPTGAARPVALARESIALSDIDWSRCHFNPGCALSLYKPDVPRQLLGLLRAHLGDIGLHRTCCRHDPGLESGSTIINNCAGCDRRFRSLYPGVRTISLWEVLDAIPNLPLPDYGGTTMSVHDSCGYRHKPQVHAAIRSLLRKMGIEVVEAALSGMQSVCCGDNFYGSVPNTQVEGRIRQRAGQFPREDVVVCCIGCVRALEYGGKRPRYLPDLLLGRATEPMPDTLDEYHAKLDAYIAAH